MAIVHGLGDHSGRYAPLAVQLVSRGMGVVALDLQGHGLSPGWRGCVDSYAALLREVNWLLTWARGGEELAHWASDVEAPNDQPISLDKWPTSDVRPVCLYGHSMGGNLVLNAVMQGYAQPDRLIASAPMLRAVNPPGPAFMQVARCLKLLMPHWRLKAPVRKEMLSHLNSEQDAYQRDAHMHRKVSLRLGAGLIDSGLWAIDNAQRLQIPALVLHGTEDRITDPRATAEFASRAGGKLQFKLYTGMLHDLHRDQGKEQVIGDIAGWVLQGHLSVFRSEN